MIVFDSVTKYFPVGKGRHYILRDVSLTIPDCHHVGVLGRNGAGKSTLIRMIGGADRPNTGEIRCNQRISWPLGLSGGFAAKLTARENVRFVCQIHGLDENGIADVTEYVLEFSELGRYFDMPLQTYSSGMKARVNFALSLAFDFDVYLVDELTAVGDKVFRAKANAAFESLKHRATLFFASHNLEILKQTCDAGLLVADETVRYFENVNDAVEAYEAGLERPQVRF